MTTIRVKHRRRYTTIDRRTINDERISFRARGVLGWLLDKPDDWRCDSVAIARASAGGLVVPKVGKADETKTTKGEGRDAIQFALRELEVAGYLVRRRMRAADGTWYTEIEVYERPRDDEVSDDDQTGFPGPDDDDDQTGFPGPDRAGKPGVGAPGVGAPGVRQNLSPRTGTDPVQEPAGTPAVALDAGLPADEVEATVLRAKQAALVIADDEVSWRDSSKITNRPGLVIHIARSDVWPVHGQQLVLLAAEHPLWQPDQLADAVSSLHADDRSGRTAALLLEETSRAFLAEQTVVDVDDAVVRTALAEARAGLRGDGPC